MVPRDVDRARFCFGCNIGWNDYRPTTSDLFIDVLIVQLMYLLMPHVLAVDCQTSLQVVWHRIAYTGTHGVRAPSGPSARSPCALWRLGVYSSSVLLFFRAVPPQPNATPHALAGTPPAHAASCLLQLHALRTVPTMLVTNRFVSVVRTLDEHSCAY